MRITHEDQHKLVIEYRPVGWVGLLLCIMCLCIGLGLRNLGLPSPTSSEILVGIGLLAAAVAVGGILFRTTERIKVTFRRSSGSITVVHRFLYKVEKQRLKLDDLEEIEVVDLAHKKAPMGIFQLISLKIRSSGMRIPLNTWRSRAHDPEGIADSIRNWVPID